MIVYMPVSKDVYQLPFGVFKSRSEVAKFLGISVYGVDYLLRIGRVVKVHI